MTEKLKDLIIEQVGECEDADLLDLIYKLLLSQRGNDLLDAGVLAG